MISFSAWRKIQNGEAVNESILGFGSMTLGFGNPQTKLGLAEKKWMDGDSDMVEPAEDKDDPVAVPDKDLKKGEKKAKNKKKGKKGKKPFVKMDEQESMSEEEAKWWESVKSHLGTDLNPKYYTGLDKVDEEKLIEPTAPKAKKEEEEPKAGEPGFAPQGRIGTIGSYAEWSEKYFSRK